jgi:hypothetical protein
MNYTFEDYLGEMFMEDFHGSKEQYENAFDAWLSNLDGDEYIVFANNFAQIEFIKGEKQGIENARKILAETFNKS